MSEPGTDKVHTGHQQHPCFWTKVLPTDGETEAGRGRRCAPSPSPGAVGLQSCARKWAGGRVPGHYTETSFTDPVFSEAVVFFGSASAGGSRCAE